MILETVAVAVWVMLPAYIPNNVAVLAGGGRPIDGGRTWGVHSFPTRRSSDLGRASCRERVYTEMSPFGGIKDSGNGAKEGIVEAMKSFTNIKTFSLPW